MLDRSVAPPKQIATASVEALDLSTMRWSGNGCMPALQDPRAEHSMSLVMDGSVVVCSGYNRGQPVDVGGAETAPSTTRRSGVTTARWWCAPATTAASL